jgi:hypothetical protein
MTDINHKGKYDEDVNVGNVNNRVEKNNAEKLSCQALRTSTVESVIKSFGDTVFENTLDKDPGKDKVHEKPEKRDVVNINPEDVYMNNLTDGNNAVKTQLYEKPERRDVMDDITPLCSTWSTRLASRSTEAGSSTCTRSLRRGMRCSRPTPKASTTRT